jgi:transposase-like protein
MVIPLNPPGGHQPPKPLDPDVVYPLYYEQELSLRAIARRLGCSRQHVANEMERWGWERRPLPEAAKLHHVRREDLDTPNLLAAYEDGATTNELAEAYDTSPETIRRRLHQASVELDPSRKPFVPKRPDLDNKAIRRDYRAGLSQSAIARRYGTTPATIRYRLLAMGEPLRKKTK